MPGRPALADPNAPGQYDLGDKSQKPYFEVN